MPLWVRLPNLPLNCWSATTLSKIASRLGRPIFADECTNKQTRVSFARVLIEIDISQGMLDEVEIVDSTGRSFTQAVKYDWNLFCQTCVKVGHVCRPQDVPKQHPRTLGQGQKNKGKPHAPRKLIQQWVPQIKLPNVEVEEVVNGNKVFGSWSAQLVIIVRGNLSEFLFVNKLP